MNVNIPAIKINHLIDFIINNYETYGPVKRENKIVFEKLEQASDLILFKEKTIIPFKKIIFPNNLDLTTPRAERIIALVGINNCDIWALWRFLDQFKSTSLLPVKENILVIGAECKPNENCFCNLMGTDAYADFDLFLQDKDDEIDIFSKSKTGDKILHNIGLKESKKQIELKKIKHTDEKLNVELLSQIINNRDNNNDIWQGISNNCFGCGSCSAVCPLCFCSRQVFTKNLSEENIRCMKWDSCFAKGFSEIQDHYDYRSKNSDRLYNWYNHKFVRSYQNNKYFLCTGCGRCAAACPANLNVKNIIETLIKKNS